MLESLVALPVAPQGNRVNVVQAHVINLLLSRFLKNHEVDVTHGLWELLALLVGEVAPPALALVELIGRKRHHNILTECPRLS